MDSVTLYTIHCPACNVLEKKLKQKNIVTHIVDKEEILNQIGLDEFPVMQVNGGPFMLYKEAREWVDKQEVMK